jgi:hypothetical protein
MEGTSWLTTESAASKIISAKKGTYSEDVINTTFNYFFMTDKLYLNEKSKAFLEKYPEFISIDLINKAVSIADKDFILEYLPNDRQQIYLHNLIPIIEKANTIEDLTDLGGYYLVNILRKFNTLPDVLINKLELLILNRKSDTEIYIIKEILGLFNDKNVSNKSLITLYTSLLPNWENLKYNLGLAIAKLGNNGKPFIPFIDEELKKNKKLIYKFDLKNNISSQFLINQMKNLQFIKDSIENGFNNLKSSPNGYKYMYI